MKRKILAVALFIMQLCVPAYSEEIVNTADYYEPVDFEVYPLKGTWDLDFTLTDDMKDFVVNNWSPAFGTLTRDNVISFKDVALSDSNGFAKWTARTPDFLNLSGAGVYGVTTLPVAVSGSSENVYVARCYFGDDVEEGERIGAFGYNVDISTLKHDRYGTMSSFSNEVFFVENGNTFERVTTVPKGKMVYLAISLFRPEYINTGILYVGRGTYHAEDDPVGRLTPEFTQLIADELGIEIDEIKYLSALQLGRPAQPTEDITSYVDSDNHEITLNLPTTLADPTAEDEEAWYAISVDITDPIWAETWGNKWSELEGENVSDYKIYAFEEDSIEEERFKTAAFLPISGVVNTWELFSMSGKKLEKFGVTEFLMVGLLNSSKPFSFYLGKLLLSLLLGGCNTGFVPSMISIVVLCAIVFRCLKKRSS